MKRKLFFAGTAALALVLGLVLAGCPMDGDDSGDGGVYTVTYNGNGAKGTAPVDSRVYRSGEGVRLKDKGTLLSPGFGFAGWNTQQNGKGTSYEEGSAFIITENTTFYAHWEEPISQSITGNESWANLLKGIQNEGKYVALDLSKWTGGGAEFDAAPGESAIGEQYIVYLTLPDKAVGIKAAGSREESQFRHFTSLAKIRGANIETIGDGAFSSCPGLVKATFPKVISIGNGAFARTSLTEVTEEDFPKATGIGEDAFLNCTALKTVNFLKAVNIGNYAFAGTALTTVNFPAATSIGDNAFAGTALTTASFTAATSIGDYAFRGCTALTTVTLQMAASIGDSAFQGCSKLTTLDLRAVTSIGKGAFAYSGKGALTVILPQSAPAIVPGSSSNYSYSKTVTIQLTGGKNDSYTNEWETNFKKLFGDSVGITLTFKNLSG